MTMLNFQQFMQNPMQVMVQKKLNIPQNIANDPQAIVQHLMNTGQMNQDTYNKLNNMSRQMMR